MSACIAKAPMFQMLPVWVCTSEPLIAVGSSTSLPALEPAVLRATAAKLLLEARGMGYFFRLSLKTVRAGQHSLGWKPHIAPALPATFHFYDQPPFGATICKHVGAISCPRGGLPGEHAHLCGVCLAAAVAWAAGAQRRDCCLDSLRGSSVKIGTTQGRLAWPLRKNDTHKSRSVNIFLHLPHLRARRAWLLRYACATRRRTNASTHELLAAWPN